MNREQFVQDATRTESQVDLVKVNYDQFRNAVAISIHSAELLNQLKRAIFYKKAIDAAKWSEAVLALDSCLGNLLRGEDANIEFMPNIDPRLLHGVIGKVTECGELLEALSNSMFNGTPLDLVNIMEELGDDDWYNAIIESTTGISRADICARVIAKLKARYPEKFTTDHAINRNLTEERAVLEGKAA